MSKRPFKASASSGRVVAGFGGFGSTTSSTSSLSYIQEPLDFSAISDSNVVVVLKNLQKRDDTTKAKALEDLQSNLDASSTVEDGLLEAWVRLFPRLSIDNNRRVRQLAVTANGKICSLSGKRVARHMPRVVGPWLAALYDSDRAVVKAAQEALSLVFPDAEKLSAVRRVYQQAVLEHCKNAILHETVSTLSDERAVSPDDAASTFSRVISSSLALLAATIARSSPDDIIKHADIYFEVLDTKTLEFAIHLDPAVRRAVHNLVRAATVNSEDIVSQRLQPLSKIYIYKGLNSTQAGSSTDFITTLVMLTQHYPTIWTSEYTGKKPAVSRLAHFLKQGSQGAQVEFWNQLVQLLGSIPVNMLAPSTTDINDLLSAMEEGMARREERAHAATTWDAYAALVKALLQESMGDTAAIIEQHVGTLMQRYTLVGDEHTQYGISAAKAGETVVSMSSVPTFNDAFTTIMDTITSKIMEQMRASLPEQSKDYEKSQLQLAATGDRWSNLQSQLLKHPVFGPSVQDTLLSNDTELIRGALQLIESRNGKPFGAAAIVDCLLRDCSDVLILYQPILELVQSFVKSKLSSLLFSPSSTYLLRLLTVLKDSADFEQSLTQVFDSIVSADETVSSKARLLNVLTSHKLPETVRARAAESPAFQDLATQLGSTQDNADFRRFLELWSAGIVAPATQTAFVKQLIKKLSTHEATLLSLQRLGILLQDHREVITAHDAMASADDRLLPIILRLSESEDDEIGKIADDLTTKLSVSNDDKEERYKTVRLALTDTNATSSSIESLATFASNMLQPDFRIQDILACLPDLLQYREDVDTALVRPPASLSISHPLGCSLYSVTPSAHETQHYDASGYSKTLRVAAFVIEILKHTDPAKFADHDEAETEIPNLLQILILSHAVLIAAEDKAHMASANDLWIGGADAESAILHDVNEMQQIAQAVVKNISSDRLTDIFSKTTTAEAAKSPSPLTYYLALARLRITSSATDSIDANPIESVNALTQRMADEPLVTIVDLIHQATRYSQHAQTLKLANDLVATLTGQDFEAKRQNVEHGLVALNTILAHGEDLVNEIAKQRVIFFVKHLLAALADTDSHIIGEEGLRLLSHLLPCISDIYGEHWSQAILIILDTWTGLGTVRRQPEHISTLYHTLRLYASLRRLLGGEDVNEDLQEVFAEKDAELTHALVALLRTANDVPDSADQPQAITNELLARQIKGLTAQPQIEVADMLPILAVPSLYIQEAAFTLAYEQLPALQEQVSLDAALDNKAARLPDELLSMLLEAPDATAMPDMAFARSVPAGLKTYLNSWRLLFAYFVGSSYKVKSDYSEQLRDGAYISRLLSLTFEILGHTRSKTVDVSAFDVLQYQAGIEQDPIQDIRWLLAHLYYLSLLHLPSLVKLYVLELRSRQMPTVIEEWTAKYVSPSIIDSSLQAVSEWAEKTVKEDPEYEKMSVKVGRRSKEVNVSYVVDEQTMAIKITLPDAYPLAPALVDGVSRVAVKEEKWQSWLRNCQGVITFSNGSITDGLAAWRRNVIGALKGQTECAICYSIISGDKQLPTKKCPTCKNLFHSSCLFKWFKTSNASTCPLCRNSFNFN